MMEAVAAAGFAIQAADVGGRALLGMLRLLKDLKETPKRMTELLEDTDHAVRRICSLKNALQQPTRFSAHVCRGQLHEVGASVDRACEAIIDLQRELDPLFRKSHMSGDGFVKSAWRSLVSVQMEKRIISRLARMERLDREVTGMIQVIGLNLEADSK